MDCRDIKELLSAYLDGALSFEEKARVEEHLKTCKECSSNLAALKEAVSQIKGLKEVEPPPLLARRIMKTIKKEARYPLRIRIPLQAAAMIAIAFTSIYLYKSFQPAAMKEAKELPKEYAAPQAPSQPPTVVGKAGPTPEKEEAVALRNAPAPAKQEAKTEDKRILFFRAAPARGKAAAPPAAKEERMADAALKKEARPMAPAQPSANAPLIAETPAMQAAPAAPAQAETPVMAAAPPAAAPAAEVALVEEKAPPAKKASAGAMRMKVESIEKGPMEVRLTLYVKDIDAAAKNVEDVLNQAGAAEIKTDSFKDRKIQSAFLSSQYLSRVIEKLKSIGELKGAEAIPAQEKPSVRIIIGLEKKS